MAPRAAGKMSVCAAEGWDSENPGAMSQGCHCDTRRSSSLSSVYQCQAPVIWNRSWQFSLGHLCDAEFFSWEKAGSASASSNACCVGCLAFSVSHLLQAAKPEIICPRVKVLKLLSASWSSEWDGCNVPESSQGLKHPLWPCHTPLALPDRQT